MKKASKILFSEEHYSRYWELNDLALLSLYFNAPVTLIDMPEIILRMKIVNELSYADLADIFNIVLNKLHKKESPYKFPDATATHYFPEIFAEPRDLYVASMLHEIANNIRIGDGEGL